MRVEWFNATGGMGLAVKWAGPGFEKELIPADALIFPGTDNVNDRGKVQP
jgi:hypothetical protein